MRVQVGGQKDLFRLAHNLKAAGPPASKLKKQLDKASRQAGNEVAKEVQDHTKDYIPQNFEHRFDTAFEAEVQVRLVQSRRITVIFYARGKAVRRDIVAMNKGKLRKPVYGRQRRLKAGGKYVREANRDRIIGDRYVNPWVEQRIRPGLVDEPAKRAMPRAVKHIENAVDRVVKEIERG